MLVISRLTKPFLGIQTNTIWIKIDKLEFFSDVLAALTALIALIVFAALIVFDALIVFAALIALDAVEIAAVTAAVIVAVVAAGDAAAADNFRISDLKEKSSCRIAGVFLFKET